LRNPLTLKSLDFLARHGHRRTECATALSAHFQHSFQDAGHPVISIDTKRKELIGNFRSAGRSWRKQPIAVLDHDFRSDARAIAVPYAIYDCQNNRGLVCVGTAAETPALAVDAIALLVVSGAPPLFPQGYGIADPGDCGGANSARARVFKWRLHRQLGQTHQVTVTLSTIGLGLPREPD
jgi:hypothetical protein